MDRQLHRCRPSVRACEKDFPPEDSVTDLTWTGFEGRVRDINSYDTIVLLLLFAIIMYRKTGLSCMVILASFVDEIHSKHPHV